MADLNNDTDNFSDQSDEFAADADFSAEFDDSGVPAIEETFDADFLNEIDNIDAGGDETDSSHTADADSSLTPAVAAKTSSDDTSQSQDEQGKTEKTAQTDDNSSEKKDEDKSAENADDADKPTEEEEKYINSLPAKEREQARRWHKNSRMQTTFLDPRVPADQWARNLKSKSDMRYGEVESAIYKEAAADPLVLLDKIFVATKDEEGFSEPYARLLEQSYETNPEFFNKLVEAKGFKIVEAGSEDADKSKTPEISAATAEEITGIEESYLFQQFKDADPDLAEKLLNGLKSVDALKTELAEAQAKIPKEQTPEEKQADEEKRTAETTRIANEQRERVTAFESAYDAEITSFVATKLKNDYGLNVTEKEQKEQPLMAFLKTSKALAIQHGIGALTDFDDGLKTWAKDKPAFNEATSAAITYAQAREKANASNALKDAQPFADLYLQERLKAPEIKMIDQIIEIVAKAQRAGLLTRTETVPSGLGKTKQAGGNKDNLLQELDDL